jgi:hypothetical protein
LEQSKEKYPLISKASAWLFRRGSAIYFAVSRLGPRHNFLGLGDGGSDCANGEEAFGYYAQLSGVAQSLQAFAFGIASQLVPRNRIIEVSQLYDCGGLQVAGKSRPIVPTYGRPQL